jgi:ABC-type glycerol-3-phosphate transport system substrate-binding protein
MNPVRGRLGPLLLAAAAALLAGACSAGKTTMHIQTNVPELADFAGLYMMEAGSPLVEIEYREQLTTDGAADLIIGRGLHSAPTMDNLSSLKNLIETTPLDKSRYYPFTFPEYKDDFVLAVLSWDAPAIITPLEDSSPDFNESVLLPLEGLTDKAAQFNQVKSGRLHAAGFSPLYSDEFIYLMFQYSGAAISADKRGYPTWRDDGVSAAISRLNSWSTSYNGGPAAENAFITKYSYAPVYQLLRSHRLTFAYSRAADFLAQDQSVVSGLSLRWATWQGRLRLLDNFVAAGIPQQSARKAEALQFIRWLLDPAVQKRLMVKGLDDGLHSFGFLGGFSTARTLTEETIPQYFPAVRLRIPPESMLDFPEAQGILWQVFKRDIFGPWARGAITANKAATPLSKTVTQWLLQMGLNP